jgi:hypothetical protein
MGYLQLNNPDKALEYMRKALQGIRNEQKIGQIFNEIFGVIFLGWVTRLRQQEIKTTISYPETMIEPSYWQDNWFDEYAEAFYGYTMECVESINNENSGLLKESYAEIILEGQLSCTFRFLREGVLLREILFETNNQGNLKEKK